MTQPDIPGSTSGLGGTEDQLLRMFANCPIGMSISRVSDRAFVDVNDAFSRMFGVPRDEAIGHRADDLNLTHPDALDLLNSSLLSHSRRDDLEIEMRTRDGKTVLVCLAVEVIELNGEAHSLTTFVDVTARKNADIAAIRCAAIVESSDDAIIGMDLDGIITDWNKGAVSIFGYARDEAIGASMVMLLPEDRPDEERHIIRKVIQGEALKNYETVRRRKDGAHIDVSITTSPIRDQTGATIGVSKVARDVTGVKQSVAALAASEARYRTLFDYAPDGIVISDNSANMLDANEAACRMLGRSRAELIATNAADIISETDVSRLSQFVDLVDDASGRHSEWQVVRKDESVFTAEAMTTAMPDGNVISMFRDVTEKNVANGRMRRLIDSKLQGVVFWKADMTIVAANDFFLEMLGYSRGDLEGAGIDWNSLTTPEFAAARSRARKEMTANGFCTPFEQDFVRKDGSRVPILIGAATFEDDPNEGVAFILDLTERKKLEARFLRAQRMESIGTLAGGIAHDLNNVLSPILMSVDLLRTGIDDPEDIALLDTVRQSAVRGAELVQQVLSFARGVESRQISVNPIHIMRELLMVTRETRRRSVNVNFMPPANLWTVTGDPSQIHQVFMNLCVNALDAMPNGGVLTVTMENVVLDDTYASMSDNALAGSFILVQVTDTGTGIPADVRERLFEPFFTTKEIGKGTGLGLSTSLTIVKSHGGFMGVYSEPGHGATFKVYLPANTAEVVSDIPEVVKLTNQDGEGKTVLLVEDEAAIRKVTATTLERFGYRVIPAVNGAEGVALYVRHQPEISVVLTDMAMPIMDGPSFIVALRSLNPDVKIIATSGFASSSNVIKAFDAGMMDFIPKPYTADTLLTAIDRALLTQ